MQASSRDELFESVMNWKFAGQPDVKERIDVYVNGEKINLYRGMKVKHALIAYDQSLYKAVLAGQVRVEDENGFMVGLEGGLANGAKIFAIGTA